MCIRDSRGAEPGAGGGQAPAVPGDADVRQQPPGPRGLPRAGGAAVDRRHRRRKVRPALRRDRAVRAGRRSVGHRLLRRVRDGRVRPRHRRAADQVVRARSGGDDRRTGRSRRRRRRARRGRAGPDPRAVERHRRPARARRRGVAPAGGAGRRHRAGRGRPGRRHDHGDLPRTRRTCEPARALAAGARRGSRAVRRGAAAAVGRRRCGDARRAEDRRRVRAGRPRLPRRTDRLPARGLRRGARAAGTGRHRRLPGTQPGDRGQPPLGGLHDLHVRLDRAAEGRRGRARGRRRVRRAGRQGLRRGRGPRAGADVARVRPDRHRALGAAGRGRHGPAGRARRRRSRARVHEGHPQPPAAAGRAGADQDAGARWRGTARCRARPGPRRAPRPHRGERLRSHRGHGELHRVPARAGRPDPGRRGADRQAVRAQQGVRARRPAAAGATRCGWRAVRGG